MKWLSLALLYVCLRSACCVINRLPYSAVPEPTWQTRTAIIFAEHSQGRGACLAFIPTIPRARPAYISQHRPPHPHSWA